MQSGVLAPPLKAKGLLEPRGSLLVTSILPAVVLLGLFIVYPFIRAGQYSFLSWDGVGPAHYAGAFNWEQIYLDPVERGSLINAATLFIFFSLIPVALGLIVVSLMCAVVLARHGCLPCHFLLAPGSRHDRDSSRVDLDPGARRDGLAKRDHPRARARTGDRTCVARRLQHRPARHRSCRYRTEFGLCFVLFLAGIQRIPTEMLDSARIDGAGLVREFRSVIVPMLRVDRRRDHDQCCCFASVPRSSTRPPTAVLEPQRPPGPACVPDAFQLGDVGGASRAGIALAIVTFILTFGVRAALERKAV